MSSFSRGGAGPGRLLHQATDERLAPSWYRFNQADPFAFTDQVWPRTPAGMFSAVWWAPYDLYEGSRCIKAIRGVTRDAAGARLAFCAVKAFRTADDVLAGETTSDVNGDYAVLTLHTGTHYLVCYKPGLPDVAGTTANNVLAG